MCRNPENQKKKKTRGKRKNLQIKKKTKKMKMKKDKKKEKRAQRGTYHPRWAQKLIFHMRTVKRNRNEFEATQRIRFQQPNKDKENGKNEKMKENERN